MEARSCQKVTRGDERRSFASEERRRMEEGDEEIVLFEGKRRCGSAAPPAHPSCVGGSPVAGVALFSKGAGESTQELLGEGASVNGVPRLAYAWLKSEVVFRNCKAITLLPRCSERSNTRGEISLFSSEHKLAKRSQTHVKEHRQGIQLSMSSWTAHGDSTKKPMKIKKQTAWFLLPSVAWLHRNDTLFRFFHLIVDCRTAGRGFHSLS